MNTVHQRLKKGASLNTVLAWASFLCFVAAAATWQWVMPRLLLLGLGAVASIGLGTRQLTCPFCRAKLRKHEQTRTSCAHCGASFEQPMAP